MTLKSRGEAPRIKRAHSSGIDAFLEVRRIVLRLRSISEADSVAFADLDAVLAMPLISLRSAGSLFADSLIYATALRHKATLWTQDEDFEDLPNVRYFPKIKA
jgi:predicted nucleic acid-binding protein